MIPPAEDYNLNKKMLRLFILFLILRGAAAASEDTSEESTSGDGISGIEDDEDLGKPRRPGIVHSDMPRANPGSDKSTGDAEANEGATLIIIIAAVSAVVLLIGVIVAIVLYRRYLRSRELGVYSVPAEQGQKAAV